VITGEEQTIRIFAAWYRSIIQPEQFLFLYDWAWLAVELKSGMDPASIMDAQVERDKNATALNEQNIKFPWVIETE